MSRRIVIFLLAASTALIAAPAAADRECFEQNCRLPDVAELPAPPPTAAADANAKSDAAAEQDAGTEAAAKPKADAAAKAAGSATSAASRKPETKATVVSDAEKAATDAAAQANVPIGVRPQMIVDLAPSPPVKPPPVYASEAGPKRLPAPKPARRTDLSPDSVPAPATAPAQKPAGAAVARLARAAPLPARAAGYGMSATPTPGAKVIVGVPGTIYPDGSVAPAYPYLQPDPSWKLCQVEQGRRRPYECGPYSYHPYGEYGHRPNGTYGGYRAAPAYVFAPNAKIITIDPAD
jgi:hypothetical protein